MGLLCYYCANNAPMKTSGKLKTTWKIFFLTALFFLIALATKPIVFLWYTHINDPAPNKREIPTGYTNDASQLNETKIEKIIPVNGNITDAIQQLTLLIKQTNAEGKKISIAGAQHSMGGHTIYPDAILLDMKTLKYLEFDSTTNILTAGSGALWADIIPFLNQRGKSVSIMQSNNSFTVGGSISVNCHGWSPNQPPIASSIQSFRLITPKGELITCSRTENDELFSLALGGYGLFGVIVDVKLSVVDNKVYKAKQYIINSKDYVSKFKEVARKPDVGMSYGRINVDKNHFMEEAILSVYILTDKTSSQSLNVNNIPAVRRAVFRGSAGSEYGKRLRWKLEKLSTHVMGPKEFTRNQLMNEGVEVFQNTDTNYTDILHEYFIPIDLATAFIDSLQQVIPNYEVELMNITVRDVKKDNDTYLAYAREDMLGFVMLYNQPMTKSGEQNMLLLTRRLIDIAITLKGTYYLPYRLHASKEQFYRAYPNADNFFALKKQYDSLEVFQNTFYNTYK